jgi:hypothetical protein
MNETDKAEFYIEVSAKDTTEEDIDRMTRQLLSELRELNVESVKLASDGRTPEGAKGDLTIIGSIALELLPVAIPSVISLVQAWVVRGQRRTVKFKGRGFEFEGSPEDLQKFFEMMEKGKWET